MIWCLYLYRNNDVVIIKNSQVMKTSNYFQFRKQDEKSTILSLEKYAEIMISYPYMVNPKVNSLWIPVTSSNRTATLNLNHRIESFTKEGYLIGENGNCGTDYMIVIVPNCWTMETVEKLAHMVQRKINPTTDWSAIRYLTPSRIDLIEECALLIGNNP